LPGCYFGCWEPLRTIPATAQSRVTGVPIWHPTIQPVANSPFNLAQQSLAEGHPASFVSPLSPWSAFRGRGKRRGFGPGGKQPLGELAAGPLTLGVSYELWVVGHNSQGDGPESAHVTHAVPPGP